MDLLPAAIFIPSSVYGFANSTSCRSRRAAWRKHWAPPPPPLLHRPLHRHLPRSSR